MPPSEQNGKVRVVRRERSGRGRFKSGGSPVLVAATVRWQTKDEEHKFRAAFAALAAELVRQDRPHGEEK